MYFLLIQKSIFKYKFVFIQIALVYFDFKISIIAFINNYYIYFFFWKLFECTSRKLFWKALKVMPRGRWSAASTPSSTPSLGSTVISFSFYYYFNYYFIIFYYLISGSGKSNILDAILFCLGLTTYSLVNYILVGRRIFLILFCKGESEQSVGIGV